MIGALETLQLLCTAAMTGIIWYVQCVHYPSFHRIDGGQWRAFHHRHTGMTGLIVAPLMLGELAAALGLMVWSDPWRTGWPGWCGLVLLAVIWGSTAFVQVPLHRRLEIEGNTATIRQLVASNWIRTSAWTLRLLCVLAGP
jgi:hypothetical protein